MKAEVHSSMDDKKYKLAVDNAVERILTKAAIVIEGRAITLVPVDTGRLKGSITYATQQGGDEVKGDAEVGDGVSRPYVKGVAHVGTNVEYAQHVEYGTRRMPKRPYLRPAMDSSRTDAQRIMKAEMRKALKDGK